MKNIKLHKRRFKLFSPYAFIILFKKNKTKIEFKMFVILQKLDKKHPKMHLAKSKITFFLLFVDSCFSVNKFVFNIFINFIYIYT